MAISTPHSLELQLDEDAKDAVAGTTTEIVTNKIKVFLGANVPAHRRQAYIGTLKAAFAHLLTEKGSNTSAGAKVIIGRWDSGTSGNFEIALGVGTITDDDVAIIVSGNVPFHRSGLSDETFKQLINVLLEKTKGN